MAPGTNPALAEGCKPRHAGVERFSCLRLSFVHRENCDSVKLTLLKRNQPPRGLAGPQVDTLGAARKRNDLAFAPVFEGFPTGFKPSERELLPFELDEHPRGVLLAAAEVPVCQ